ncbi:MAG: efflux RND transporter periplasmic adaptor subunit [Acidobacteria bacterium]|nr:efflux RND transporter periplasmic adaptor subunit [Acidobacteriota bacterium]
MTRTTKITIAGTVVIAIAGAGGSLWWRGPDLPTVAAEAVRRRDLDAVVSASGKIQPQRQVNVSANTMGRVTRLAVQEGAHVREGQFLLEIDPRSLEGQLQRGEAGVAAARSALLQARVGVEQAGATLELARQSLRRQEELWAEGLTTRESLERAQNDVAVREAELRTREQEIRTREEQVKQEQASLATTQYNVSQVTISAPMTGMITRRNIEEGENVMVGTMNNAGTVLLTIADMTVLESEIEVDETDIPAVTLGQDARVTIDAVPNRTFRGRVTEVGNSPIQTAGNASTAQATNFKVVITLDEEVPGVRPGFTCTAEITTATRKGVVSVPIQAVTVREMLYDESGTLVHEPPPTPPSRFRLFRRPATDAVVAVPEPPPGHTRMETEGVFVLRDGRAVFAPITVGIAGERYFEVLSGVTETDRIITGPFTTVRELADGAQVALQDVPDRP